jgi:type IV pilus assembly protein PilM
MATQIVGLKLGASHLTAALVSRNGTAELLQVAREPLERGVVSGGEVRDVELLAAALRDFFAKHKLPARAVRVGVASNRIGVRTVELTGITDPKQMENAVRFRAQEVLPIPLQDAVLDFQVLADSVDEEGQPSKKVLLVVAYRDLVSSVAQACRQAGLRLVGIDLEAYALLRALLPAADVSGAELDERSAIVAVSVGSERSTLAVTDGLTCEFNRVLDWGGGAMTSGLARALEIELDDAEALKRQLSLDGDEIPDGLDEEQARKAHEALRAGMQQFARELVSSLQYYQSQPDSLGIREIVLAGGTSQLGGLAESLQRLIGVTVRLGDPTAGVTLTKKLRDTNADPALAVPIGLGMGV